MLVAGCAGAPDVEVAFPDDVTQIAMPVDAIAWRKCPPTLPPACEMAVLEGDPTQARLFTVRFRTGEAFEMRPHWHPRNERVTVLEGKVGVGFGDQRDPEDVTWFGPGDYYVNAKEAHHFVLTDGPVVLQITGIGPWKAHFLEPN